MEGSMQGPHGGPQGEAPGRGPSAPQCEALAGQCSILSSICMSEVTNCNGWGPRERASDHTGRPGPMSEASLGMRTPACGETESPDRFRDDVEGTAPSACGLPLQCYRSITRLCGVCRQRLGQRQPGFPS